MKISHYAMKKFFFALYKSGFADYNKGMDKN